MTQVTIKSAQKYPKRIVKWIELDSSPEMNLSRNLQSHQQNNAVAVNS